MTSDPKSIAESIVKSEWDYKPRDMELSIPEGRKKRFDLDASVIGSDPDGSIRASVVDHLKKMMPSLEDSKYYGLSVEPEELGNARLALGGQKPKATNAVRRVGTFDVEL